MSSLGGQLVGRGLVTLPKSVAFSTTVSSQRSSIGSVPVLGMAEVYTEVPGGSVVVAATVVDVPVAASDVVMGVAAVDVDVSVERGVAVPVCKPPRKVPAATEMPTSKRRRCNMPSARAVRCSV